VFHMASKHFISEDHPVIPAKDSSLIGNFIKGKKDYLNI